ncbi:hypothetical protein TBLA_0F00100 [Henningerozyma blattae CBS 6284]|uniref:Uncharacterized protein n=1 Tax=Henningerozyma blattae (strain ATCC 34711 / CBS 6284 / DSM 70876 / NBRC 10599 / NRRL Y-10934 / UCD 77-7) TaxID=1071380 RepID=I2H5A2_HENB6|nr:hypothetical protein TBLA_0F00100 [Tetrapisispora blattae CBS 6284]CCH61554.1 hypothetical protein TBLA_0F00100 [Tetrapisispora blattae CBS 6284]
MNVNMFHNSVKQLAHRVDNALRTISENYSSLSSISTPEVIEGRKDVAPLPKHRLDTVAMIDATTLDAAQSSKRQRVSTSVENSDHLVTQLSSLNHDSYDSLQILAGLLDNDTEMSMTVKDLHRRYKDLAQMTVIPNGARVGQGGTTLVFLLPKLRFLPPM